MDFLSINQKYLDFLLSESSGERLKNGALLLGSVVANTAIAAGKVTHEVAKRLPDLIEKETSRLEQEQAQRANEKARQEQSIAEIEAIRKGAKHMHEAADAIREAGGEKKSNRKRGSDV